MTACVKYLYDLYYEVLMSTHVHSLSICLRCVAIYIAPLWDITSDQSYGYRADLIKAVIECVAHRNFLSLQSQVFPHGRRSSTRKSMNHGVLASS